MKGLCPECETIHPARAPCVHMSAESQFGTSGHISLPELDECACYIAGFDRPHMKQVWNFLQKVRVIEIKRREAELEKMT